MEWLLAAVVVIALVFDFTNGFHDAANAVATSISTRAIPPNVALFGAAVRLGYVFPLDGSVWGQVGGQPKRFAFADLSGISREMGLHDDFRRGGARLEPGRSV